MNRVRRFNFQTIKYHLYYYSVDWQKLEVSLIYNLPRRQYWVWLRLLIILIEGTTENHSNPTRIPVLSFRLKYSSTFFLLACWSFTVEQLISVALWKSKTDCLVLKANRERIPVFFHCLEWLFKERCFQSKSCSPGKKNGCLFSLRTTILTTGTTIIIIITPQHTALEAERRLRKAGTPLLLFSVYSI